MKKHKVYVTQVFKVTRTIAIDVDNVDSLEAAIAQVKNEDIAIPEFDNVNWKSSWDLKEESITGNKLA